MAATTVLWQYGPPIEAGTCTAMNSQLVFIQQWIAAS